MLMRKTHFILYLLFVVTSLFSQTDRVEFDYSVFEAENGGSLELYYSFIKTKTDYVKNKEVKGSLDVKIQNTATDELVINKYWHFNYDSSDAQNKYNIVTGVLKFVLKEGSYNCTLVGYCDVSDDKSNSKSFNIDIFNTLGNEYSISDIQVATFIKQYSKDTTSIFYKNTLEVVPNPSLIFGQNLPALYYYSEIYNLDQVDNTELFLEVNLLNSYNEKLYSKLKKISSKYPSIVEQGALKVNSYPTGTYNFVLSVSDKKNNTNKISEKKIFLFNPTVIDTVKRNLAYRKYTSSEFALLTENELNDYFAIVKYITSSEEKEDWSALNDEQSKMKFLFNFWLKRDPTPETVLNEVKIEYFSRVNYADKNFSTISKERGALTERGRVLLMYGHPSDVERHPSDTETKPYEIWFYDEIEGGVIFVFADFYGYSDYRLIHSTKRNELKDIYWEQTISTY